MAYYYQTCNFHKVVIKHNLILLSHQLTLYYKIHPSSCSIELLEGLKIPQVKMSTAKRASKILVCSVLI